VVERRYQIIGLLLILVLVGFALHSSSFLSSSPELSQAPDFQGVDQDGRIFSLKDLLGQPLVLHINSVENPLCRECEPSLRSQIAELEDLASRTPKVNIVTINIRKNPYSEDGKTLAEIWWKSNISWRWVEDFEPYPLANRFLDYTSRAGGFSNPTLLLIDQKGRIVEVYHVYQMGKGQVDGVQDADTLYSKIQDLKQGSWTRAEVQIYRQSVSYLGMFILGIVTSLSPCSIALMIAVFSYIMASFRRDERLKASGSSYNEGFLIGVAFTLGMGMVFFFLGIFISQLGTVIREARLFDLIAGLLMIALGINNLKPWGDILEPLKDHFSRERREDESKSPKKSLLERMVHLSMTIFARSSLIGAFSLGVFFALGWAPCAVSLVFPVLIWLASQEVSPLAGGLMLFLFGIGHGVPIIPISTFSRSVAGKIGDRYVSVGRYTTGIFGAMVIVVGLIYTARYFGITWW
jgi:cytochrome c biogenesis protein CcdA/peroxiredoxin